MGGGPGRGVRPTVDGMATDRTDEQRDDDATPSAGRNWGVGVALGVGIGVAFGVALGNIALGIAFGAAFVPVFAMLNPRGPGSDGTGPAEPDDTPRDPDPR